MNTTLTLIADGGSTKTDWLLHDVSGTVCRFQTQGINPVYQSKESITQVLLEECVSILTERMSDNRVSDIRSSFCGSLYFYGSGVRKGLEPYMCDIISSVFPNAFHIECHSDLLGAARALCGEEEGIACILGTGSNSCLFDGRQIIANIPALGYILGDEGSGAVLGRRFLNALYKGCLPHQVETDFQECFEITLNEVIDRVYRQPLANRYLASLSPFIHSHLHVPEIRAIVVDNFREFFRKNIAVYNRHDLAINTVGSIAYCYADELGEAATLEGFTIGKILKSPLDGIIK